MSSERMIFICPQCKERVEISVRRYAEKKGNLICKSCSMNNIKIKNKDETVNTGKCIIRPTKEITRCKNYLTCNLYERCLDIAHEKGWNGWTEI